MWQINTTVFTGSYSTATLINNRWSGAFDRPRPASLQLDLSTDRLASAWVSQAGGLGYLRHWPYLPNLAPPYISVLL